MNYETIEKEFWNDRDFDNVSVVARFLYIWTFSNEHSHGLTGLYKLPRTATIAAETGIDADQLATAFDELVRADKIGFFKDWIWIKGVGRRNIGKSPNHNSGIVRRLREVPRELASAFVIRYPQLIQAKGIEADGEFLTSLYQPLLQPTLSGGAIEGLGRGLQGANKEGKGGAEPSISNPIPNTNRTETETESELNTENRAQFEQSTPLAEATDPKTDPKPTENEGEADPRADPKANLDATDSETAKKRQDVAESELDKPWIRKTWQDLAFCLKIDLGNPNPIDARQAKQDSEYLFKLLEIVCREAIVKNKKLSKQRELLMQMAREIHSCKQKAISPMAVFRDKCQAIWPDPSEERKQDIKNPLRIGA